MGASEGELTDHRADAATNIQTVLVWFNTQFVDDTKMQRSECLLKGLKEVSVSDKK